MTGMFVILAATTTAIADSDGGEKHDWPVAGHDLNNSRSQPNEKRISPANIATLQPAWVFTAGGDISATPAVAGNAVYFPDWAGNLYAVDKNKGTLIWSTKISDYDKMPGSLARVTPAVAGDLLILGDIESKVHSGANVIAVDRNSGIMRWMTQVDTHPAAIITGSPVVAGNTVYVGVSSSEEGLATNPAYPCCSFRGSIVALDLHTGKIKWQTFTMPDNQGLPTGYSGGAVWQPFAIDQQRRTLYAGTGNNYEVPQSVKDCLATATGSAASACFAADDYFDTALALDLDTGRVKWATRVQGEDVWTVACLTNPNPVACPEPSSPDYDLGGSGPNLLPGLVGFGQKSGIYWALDPDSGKILWSSVVGPGSTLGGIEWGTATDGKHIFVSITNGGHKPYPLIDGSSTTGGAWSALDAATGKILWQTADPTGATDPGSLSYANGIVFAPSYSGNMSALDSATGKILWTFQSGGSVVDGPAIVDGNVYWGSGYSRIKPGTANNKLFAFTTKGKGGDEGNEDGDGQGSK